VCVCVCAYLCVCVCLLVRVIVCVCISRWLGECVYIAWHNSVEVCEGEEQ